MIEVLEWQILLFSGVTGMGYCLRMVYYLVLDDEGLGMADFLLFLMV